MVVHDSSKTIEHSVGELSAGRDVFWFLVGTGIVYQLVKSTLSSHLFYFLFSTQTAFRLREKHSFFYFQDFIGLSLVTGIFSLYLFIFSLFVLYFLSGNTVLVYQFTILMK